MDEDENESPIGSNCLDRFGGTDGKGANLVVNTVGDTSRRLLQEASELSMSVPEGSAIKIVIS